ncbi:hypothetical protein B0H21DRAFT_718505 [Amylocystis lapponica]|nr:hypothetical protein B0H21DRAFT_718505 [Amylocystis lapponica]
MSWDLLKSVQAALAAPATQNLRRYISLATLPTMPLGRHAPEMPPEGHKSHRNTLSVIPQGYRRLETMHLIDDPYFIEDMTAFLNHYIPSASLDAPNADPQSGEQITVPCSPYYNLPERAIGQVATVDRVFRWVTEYPLDTVQRIMHLVFSESDDWAFSEDKRIDIDDQLIRHLIWGPAASVPIPVADFPKPTVSVVIQPPWILSPKDFELFVECVTLPSLQVNTNLQPQIYDSKERLWGKLWDVCFRNKSHWFVVTTYWGWVFGVFSKGWTRGFVTSIRTSQEESPTILEYLIYWFASAIGIPGGWEIPEVPEPVDTVGLEIARSIPPPFTGRIPVAPSVSNFSCHSEAYMSDAGTEETDEVERILTSLTEGHFISPLPSRNPLVPQPVEFVHDRVQEWQARMGPDTDWDHARAPSPTFSQSSASTVRDYTDQMERHGAWLTGHPTMPVILE